MNDVEKILKLGELGFSAEQISSILDINKDMPSESKPVAQPEIHTLSEHDAPENVVGKLPDAIKEAEMPRIDYAKLADEIAIRQQKHNTFNPEPPKVEAPPAQKSAEEITMGLL